MEVRHRIHIDTRAWKQAKEQIASFETLQTAVWEDKKLDICYQRADGSTVERTVAPLGLVAKGNVWYLVALCEDDVRTYRASRIAKAALVEEQFARPPDFDLAHYWQRSTQAFVDNLPQFDVRVEVTTAVLARLKFSGRFVQLRDVGDADVAGWTPVTLRFDTEAEALATILGFADQMKIIEPYDLIHKVVAMAESVVTFYKNI